jgi:hypothetical protein
MKMQQTCDPDRLDAFVRGELSEQQESELTAHLDQCAACGEEPERRVAAADQWREAGELLTHRARQWTLLLTALQRSCLETTSLLLQHGANPNFASKGTPLPLELAKRSGRKVLVALVQKYLESNAPNSQTNVDVHAAELQGNWRLVYQPLDVALETSEVGYSLSIGEQTLTLAGHSHPCKLLPENTIQWNYPPEYAGKICAKIGARHMTDGEQ